MKGLSAPLPPAELATRVGPGEVESPLEAYESEGAAVRARLESLLPSDWSFDGKRVLDFGCGSARVLRHFLDEARRAEFWGCDIHGPSIQWVQRNLSPPLHCFQNGYAPPLDLEDGTLDLVWATSVFTHIGDLWSDWVLELHRVLAPDGLFIASFLGEAVWDALLGEPYLEDEVGMWVHEHWTRELAWVFHSEWWLRAHWGRAFDVLEVRRPPRDSNGVPQVTHSYIVLSKRSPTPTKEELEHLEPGEPREVAALQTNVRLLKKEIGALVAERPTHAEVRPAWRDAVLRSPVGPLARQLKKGLRGTL